MTRMEKGFKLIAFTPERIVPRMDERICEALDAGFDFVHFRCPNETMDGMRKVLRRLGNEERKRVVIHDNVRLAEEFEEIGVSENARNREDAKRIKNKGIRTRGCHSIEELGTRAEYEYVFLSPIFPSISKRGYVPSLTKEEIEMAREMGIIDERVMALGGITIERIEEVRSMGFGGAGLLGCLSEMWVNGFKKTIRI